MTKKLSFAAAVVMLGLVAAASAAPQSKPASPAAKAPTQADIDKLVELLRKDVRAQKSDILAKTMTLDAAQSGPSGPSTRKQYEAERAALGDERVAIIQDFASSTTR